jgi:hypothetical protein
MVMPRACLELLLTYAAARDEARLASEHLVIAAGRSGGDVHAPGVVALLLQGLQQRQQLAAKWLRRAYAAACSSGNIGVLQQLLQALAAAAAAAAVTAVQAPSSRVFSSCLGCACLA